MLVKNIGKNLIQAKDDSGGTVKGFFKALNKNVSSSEAERSIITEIFKTDESKQGLASLGKDAQLIKENFKDATPTLREWLSTLDESAITTKNASQMVDEYNTYLQTTSSVAKKAGTALKSIGQGLKALAINFAISLAVTAITAGVEKIINANKNAVDSAKKLTETFEEQRQKIEDGLKTIQGHSERFKELSRGVSEYGTNISLTASEYDEYNKIVRDIIAISPSLIEGWDAEGNAIINKNNAIQETIDKLKEERELQGFLETSSKNVKTLGKGAVAEYKKLLPGQRGNDLFKTYEKETENIYNKVISLLNPINLKDRGAKNIDRLGLELNSLTYDMSDPEILAKSKAGDYRELYNFYFEGLGKNKDKIKALLDESGVGDVYNEIEKYYYKVLDNQKKYDSQLEKASKSFNSTLLNVARYTDGYNELTDSQRKFVTQYINGFKIDENTSADDIDKMRDDVIDFVNKIFEPPNYDTWSNDKKAKYKAYFDDIFALDKNLSVSEFQNKFNEAWDKLKTFIPEDTWEQVKNGLLNSYGAGNDAKGNSVIDEMIGNLKNKAGDTFGGINWKEALSVEELQTASENIEDIDFTIIKSIDDLKKKLQEFKSEGKKANFVTNLFKSKDEDGKENSFGKLSTQIDKIQSAYQTLFNAINQYNEEGFISVDTYQSILETGSQYLKFLFDENGNLKLNKEALKELTLARIEEQGAKAKEALLDNVKNIRNEADAQEYLKDSLKLTTEATASLTEEVLKLEYARMLNSNIPKDVVDSVMNNVISQFNNITRLTDMAKSGLDKSADAGMGAVSSAKDLKKQLKDLNDRQKLNNLQYAIDKTTEKINALDRTIEILNAALELTSENDPATRFEYMSQKMDLSRQKASELKAEFENLINVQPDTAAQAEALASRMEQVGNSLRENYKSAVEARVEMARQQMELLDPIGDDWANRSSTFVSDFSKGLDRLKNGGLYTFETAFLPNIPKSAYEKQKQENDMMVADQQRMADEITKIKKQALELQKKENDKAIADERAKLAAALDETVQRTRTANSEISKDILDTSNIIGNTIDTTAQNAVNSIDNAVDHIKGRLGELKGPLADFNAGFDINNPWGITPTVHGSNEKLNNVLSAWIGKPYLWGGSSKSGTDCSGLFRGVLSDMGIDAEKNGIPRTAADLYSSSQHISEEDLQPGDLVFYKTNGRVSHVGIYVGNGKMVHAPGTGKPVQEKDFDPKKAFGYGRYSVFSNVLNGYASGTNQGNIKSKKLGIAGENNRPEILIDKDSGRHEYISSPTLIDTSKTDVVGEQQTSRIKKYATGTPMTNKEWLKYLKEACDALNLPYKTALSLIDQESSNGEASDTWKVNSAGAYGLTQITPSALADLTDGTAVANKFLTILKNNGIDINKSRTGGAANARENIWTGLATLSAIKERYFKGDDPELRKSLGWYYAGGNWNGKDGQWYANSVINRANTNPFLKTAKELGDNITEAAETYKDVLTDTNKQKTAMDEYISSRTSYDEDEVKTRYAKLQSELSKEIDAVGEFYSNAIHDETPEGRKALAAYRGDAKKSTDQLVSKQMSLGASQAFEIFKGKSEDVRLGQEYINQMIKEGATEAELTGAQNELQSKIQAKETASNDYVTAIKSAVDYFADNINQSSEDFKRKIDNIDAERAYIRDEMDIAKDSDTMASLYNRDRHLIEKKLLESNNTKDELQAEFYAALDTLATNDSPLKDSLSKISMEQFFDHEGNLDSKYLDEYLAPYIASNNPNDQALATNISQIVKQFGVKFHDEYKNAYTTAYEAQKELVKADREKLEYALEIAEHTYQRMAKDVSERNEKLTKENTRINGLMNITSDYYSTMNKLSDLQHEADNAIAESRISRQYLNQDEYERIYNEGDYEKTSKKIQSTKEDIDWLTRKFKSDVQKAYDEDNLYLVETITAEYKRQVALKEQELEITKSEVTLRQKQQQLEKILSEKNIRQMREVNGKFVWEWVADADKVRQATTDLSNAQYDLDQKKTQEEQTIDLNEYQAKMDNINNIKAANEQWLSELSKGIETFKDSVTSFEEPIKDMATAVDIFREYGIEGLGDAVNDFVDKLSEVTGETYTHVVKYNGKIVKANKNGLAPKGLEKGTMVSTEGGNYLITGVNANGSYTSVPTKAKPNTYGKLMTPEQMKAAGLIAPEYTEKVMFGTSYAIPNNMQIYSGDTKFDPEAMAHITSVTRTSNNGNQYNVNQIYVNQATDMYDVLEQATDALEKK